MSRFPPPNPHAPRLTRMSIVIPARDEEGSVASTVEHLHLELRLQQIPHEIVVVDDGSQDRTWEILENLRARFRNCLRCGTPGSTASAARLSAASMPPAAMPW